MNPITVFAELTMAKLLFHLCTCLCIWSERNRHIWMLNDCAKVYVCAGCSTLRIPSSNYFSIAVLMFRIWINKKLPYCTVILSFLFCRQACKNRSSLRSIPVTLMNAQLVCALVTKLGISRSVAHTDGNGIK